MLDISCDGCRVKLDSVSMPLGSTVVLDVGGVATSGEVAWSDGGNSGIRFHRPLPADVAVHFGLETPQPARARSAADRAQPGASHWLRRVPGAITDRSRTRRVA